MATAEGSAQGLTPAHKRFLIRDALLIAAVVNGVLSALIAWLVTVGEDEVPNSAVPLIEGPSVVVDTVGTFFVLPFLTTLAITTVIWKEMREGHLTRLPLAPGSFADAAAGHAPAPRDPDRPAVPARAGPDRGASCCSCSTTAAFRSASS